MAITDLANATTPADTDKFWGEQGSADYYWTRAQIVAGVAADLAAEIATTDAEITAIQADRLKIDGTIAMTGDLTLSGAPTSNLHASTKLYVDTADALKATIASPTFTGTPAAPTAADGTSTTQLATTAFVGNQLDEYVFERTEITGATHTLTEDEAGYVGVNRAGTVGITLPTISGLTNAGRVFYKIKDEGFNANATTQLITITRGGSDTIENAGTSTTISTAGEDIYLYNDGTSAWYLSSVDTQASATATGVVELATTAEAQALSDAARVITPSTLADVLDQELYKSTELGAASKTLVEADAGRWYVTYTSTGAVSMVLPDPTGLSDATKCTFEIVDQGAASTNNITITSGGSATLDGATSIVISKTRAGAKFFTDGTDWFTTANTQNVAGDISGTATYLSKFNTAGDGIVDSKILDNGTTMAINGSVDSNSLLTIRNSSLRNSFNVLNTGTASINEASKFASSGVASTNYGVVGSALNGTNGNTAFYAADSPSGGVAYYAYGAVVGGTATSSYGVNVSNNSTGTNAYGASYTINGAATTNYGVYINVTGGSTNTGLKIAAGDIDLGDAAVDIELDTSVGTKLGTAASQKLGFWNTTPVVQPTTAITAGAFVANTSGISDDTATFDGYTIGEIAAALRQVGILA